MFAKFDGDTQACMFQSFKRRCCCSFAKVVGGLGKVSSSNAEPSRASPHVIRQRPRPHLTDVQRAPPGPSRATASSRCDEHALYDISEQPFKTLQHRKPIIPAHYSLQVVRDQPLQRRRHGRVQRADWDPAGQHQPVRQYTGCRGCH